MNPSSGLVWCLALVSVLSAISGRAAEAGSPFLSGTLEQAQVEAARSQKKVLVAVWGSWGEDSQKLQRSFTENVALKTLVAAQTVAVQFDALSAPEVTRALHTVVLPAVVLLSGDGTEIERWAGDVSSAQLLRELPAAFKGRTTLMRVREHLPATFAGRLKNTEKLLAVGSRAAALAELLWLYDEGLGEKLMISGVGNTTVSEVIGAIGRLRTDYPPADTALTVRRARERADLLKKPGDQGSALKLAVIDLSRGGGAATLETWRKLPASSGRNVLAMAIVPDLVRQRRYEEAAQIYPADKASAFLRDAPTPSMRFAKSMIGQAVVPRLRGERAEAAYAAIFFEAYVGAGLDGQAKDAAAIVSEKGGPKVAPSLLRAAAVRALGEKAEGLLTTLGVPPAPPAAVVPAGTAPAPLAVAAIAEDGVSDSDDEPEAVSSTTDDLVRMGAVVVEGKPRGMIPIPAVWRSKLLTGKISRLPVIVPLRPNAGGSKNLERFEPQRNGLKVGERLIAVAGEATAEMSNARLNELYLEGDVGAEVAIVVQGTGADAAIFREVTVKRVGLPPKTK